MPERNKAARGAIAPLFFQGRWSPSKIIFGRGKPEIVNKSPLKLSVGLLAPRRLVNNVNYVMILRLELHLCLYKQEAVIIQEKV